MNDDTAARFLIEMRAEAFDAARTHGGLCAICGRELADDEPVWLERCPVPHEPRARLRAPVGRECASPEALDRSDGHEAERCAGCGRGVYYGARHARRGRALCSKRCLGRVASAKRQAAKGVESMENGTEQRDLVDEAQEIEQDVAPRPGPGEDEAPTEESAHD